MTYQTKRTKLGGKGGGRTNFTSDGLQNNY